MKTVYIDKTSTESEISEDSGIRKENYIETRIGNLLIRFVTAVPKIKTITNSTLVEITDEPDLPITGNPYFPNHRLLSSNIEDSKSKIIESTDGLLYKNIYEFYKQNKNEEWVLKESVKCKVLEVLDNVVILDCLIDIETKRFQERQINKSMFKYIDELYIGKLIIINVFENPPESKIRIEDGEGKVDPNLFSNEEYIEKLKKSSFFKE